MLVRLFIFQHDCGHGSFFSSPRLNEAVGRVLGVVTLMAVQLLAQLRTRSTTPPPATWTAAGSATWTRSPCASSQGGAHAGSS
jgi:fatty acid desaturase